MKTKSLAMVAASALLAASFAYIAPAIADDTTGQSTQAPSSDASTPNSGSTDNTMNNNSTDNSSNTSGTDQGTPDTATGDDDY